MGVNIAIVPLSPFESSVASNISVLRNLNSDNKLRERVFKQIIEKESDIIYFYGLI